MRYCSECKVNIRGDLQFCPLCEHPLDDVPSEQVNGQPFPYVPLRFHQNKLTLILVFVSVGVVALLFTIQAIFPRLGLDWIHIVLTIIALWTLVIAIVRKRRNIAKAIVYQQALLSIFSLAWDYLGDQIINRSLTYALPLISFLALIAISLSMVFVRYELGDYILYLLATALVSLIPLILNIIFEGRPLWPAIITASLGALVFIVTLIVRRTLIIHELKKRFHF